MMQTYKAAIFARNNVSGARNGPTVEMEGTTVVSRVSAHGRLNITRDFGPHGHLHGI